jgi:hypothetical protein
MPRTFKLGAGQITILIVVGLCILVGAANRLSGRATTPAPTPGATLAAVAAAPTNAPPTSSRPPAPTKPPAPTNTTGPTNTPAPTTTPTTPPTETPAPTAVPPLDLKGRGQKVTDQLQLPASLVRIRFTHTGRSNFIVKAYGADGQESYLVNAIGHYTGVRPLVADGPVYFEIQADGPWDVHIEAMSQEPGAATLSGKGDYVSGLFAPERNGPVPYAFAHNGKANFIVHLYCAGGNEGVQNEIGAVQNEAVVRITQGPCFWEVQADGAWTLGPK